jgi:hypothetical protein
MQIHNPVMQHNWAHGLASCTHAQMIFSVVMHCGLSGSSSVFEEHTTFTFRAEMPWRWRQYVHPKRWYLSTVSWRWRQYAPQRHWYPPTSPHGITIEKANTDIFTTMKTSNLNVYVVSQHTCLMKVIAICSPINVDSVWGQAIWYIYSRLRKHTVFQLRYKHF